MHRLFLPVLALGLLLLPSPSADAAGKPSMPSLSEKDEERLADGKLVLKKRKSDESSGGATGVIEIAANEADIWKILLSFHRIPETSSAVKKVTPYGGSPGDPTFGIRYDVEAVGNKIVYHVMHRYNAAGGYLTWSLDPNKPNDIDATAGSFSTHPGKKPGTIRFLYKASIDSGRNVPEWIEDWLTNKNLRTYLKWVKSEAE